MPGRERQRSRAPGNASPVKSRRMNPVLVFLTVSCVVFGELNYTSDQTEDCLLF